jgi:glutathione synthase
MKYNMLVVTDHATHAETNSVYQLSQVMKKDPRCQQLWVCSRGLEVNQDFFNGEASAPIYASAVTPDFDFDPEGRFFHESPELLSREKIDAILIRLPQPVDDTFLYSLQSIVSPNRIINSPAGIVETATKAFLLNVSYLCPEPVMCHSIEQALQLSREKEIVLKPLHAYGGRGMVRLSRAYCWNENTRLPVDRLSTFLTEAHFPMLSMTFLKNVTMGDKRTIVVNYQVLGSALRMPAPGSWMCNVAQGGHAVAAEPDEEEQIIERTLTPLLHRKGVIMYGFDTLVGDDGRRVLSEINTLSIGGLVPLESLTGKPVLKRAAGLLWDHIEGKEG